MTPKTHLQNSPTKRSLPTRQELLAFLQAKGQKPEALTHMNTWEQIQLTAEYQQSVHAIQ